jgi:hypothetical protein
VRICATLGTFLRSFTFGHVRQLDRVLGVALGRAWAAGAGPGDERLVVDVDSFVGEVYGYDKQGAGYGYTHKLGYHPIVATRAGTGEVIHIRARKGSANTSRGALRFVEELIPRVTRAGATGPKLLRADSGFWNTKIMDRLHAAGWMYSIGVRQQTAVAAAIAQIPETDWQTLEDYPDRGEAQIAETTLGHRRLVVRRTRLVGAQAELWPDWRHHPFLTNRVEPLVVVEAEHRQHAVIELAIRDLKDQVATLVHELAHALMPLVDGRPALSYAEEELVVESVTFIVCAGAGLDVGDESIPYVAGWGDNGALDAVRRRDRHDRSPARERHRSDRGRGRARHRTNRRMSQAADSIASATSPVSSSARRSAD